MVRTAEMADLNARLVDVRIEAGLARLRTRYCVRECAVDEVLANPVVGGRLHHARRFDIEGVGNLLAMTVTEAEENQLSSFVITPYAKDLPLLSTDYVYSGDKRFFLIEVYGLVLKPSAAYLAFLDALAARASAWSDMPDIPTKPCWYDGIRPLCIAKAPSAQQDDDAQACFIEALDLFMEMERATPLLSDVECAEKWKSMKGYSDRLVDEGGVSTDLFTQAIGAENTRRFFDEVFFGPACYMR